MTIVEMFILKAKQFRNKKYKQIYYVYSEFGIIDGNKAQMIMFCLPIEWNKCPNNYLRPLGV